CDLLRRDRAEREPGGSPPARAVRVEVGAVDEAHALPFRSRQELAAVHPVGQVEPDEVATLWVAPARPGEPRVECGEHRVAPSAEEPADPLDVRFQPAADEKLV